jgi:hypothetical protein
MPISYSVYQTITSSLLINIYWNGYKMCSAEVSICSFSLTNFALQVASPHNNDGQYHRLRAANNVRHSYAIDAIFSQHNKPG